MVLYGPTGTGKTSMLAHFWRTAFVTDSQDQGIRYLLARRLVPEPVILTEFPNAANSWEKLIAHVYALSGRNDIDSVILESLIGFQKILFMFHARERFGTSEHPDGDITSGDKGFWSYQKGPKNAAEFDWPNLIEACNACLASGKNVIFSGHSKDKQNITAHGTVHQKNFPVCEREIWDQLNKWASIVAYCSPIVEEDKVKSKGLLKKIAKEDMKRHIYLATTPFAEAKNWWGLRHVIPMGDDGASTFKNFIDAF